MKRSLLTSCLMSLMFLVSYGNGTMNHSSSESPVDTKIDKSAFQSSMRKLWEDHITWTRLYIISALSELPDKGATTNRLLQNQTDIGNAIKPLYGEAAGEKLTALLRDHILIAADLIAASQSGDAAKSKDANDRWYKNADEIAAFLSSANPKHWAQDEMKSMMHDHLSATTAEVVARLHKDWDADVKSYDKVHEQILEMADMLSTGIIEQFHSKFK